jgi:hypothetical protein
MIIKNLISFLLFVFIAIQSNAVPIQYDSIIITQRKFDTKNIEQLKKKHKYDYGKEQITKKPSNNYIQKLIQQFFEKLYRAWCYDIQNRTLYNIFNFCSLFIATDFQY